MNQIPSILYAEVHQRISAFLSVVVTPRGYVDDGDIEKFGTDIIKFQLKANTPRSAPRATEWVTIGLAESMGPASREMVNFLKVVWPHTDWINIDEEVFWVPARPASDEVRERLLQECLADRRRE